MPTLPLILLSPLMAVMVWTDLRYMRIPNWLVLAALVLAAGLALTGLMPQIGLRLIAAAVMLAIGLALFAMRMMGGGDAKILAALMLFIPPAALPEFAMLLSAMMLVGAALVFGMRRVAGHPESTWVSLRASRRYPLGLSIGAAAMALPVLL